MPFNGSGTFSRLYSWVVDAANNVNISSSRMDAELNGLAAALTNCITRDGQSPPSANLPMGGLKITNLGNATGSTDALNLATGDTRYVLASGATNLTLSGTLTVATVAISGNATVGAGGTLTASGPFVANGSSTLAAVTVTGNITVGVAGTLTTNGPFVANGSATFAGVTDTGSMNVGSTLSVTGASTVAALTASGLITGSAGFSGTTLGLSSTLSVTGLATLNGGVTSSGALTLTGALSTGTSANSVGYVGAPSNVKTANYTLASSDIGQDITFNGTTLTCTIPAGLPNGFVAIVANINSSPLTITSASDTLTQSGTTTTGNRTLGQNGEARVIRRNGVLYIGGTALS